MAFTPQQAAANGKSWVDKNHPLFGTSGFVGPEDDDDAQAPAAASPPPVAPTAAPIPPPAPGAVLGPVASAGPLVANPDGSATHQPTAGVLGPSPLQDGAPVAQPAAPAPSAAPQEALPAAAPTVNDAFKKALLDRLTKPVGVDPNDPTIKGQTDAFNQAQQRAKERARAAMAERVSGNGGPGINSGAFEGGLLGLEEAQGDAEAGFAANLTGQELQRQHDELTRFMAFAGDQLSGEESRALQERLANLSAQIQREGLAQSGTQFNRGLSEQQRQFDIEATLKRLGIDTQAGQFDRSLLEQGREADLDAEMKRRGIDLQGELGRIDNDTRRHGIDVNSTLGLLQLLMERQNFMDGEAGTNARFGAGLDAETWRALFGGLG